MVYIQVAETLNSYKLSEGGLLDLLSQAAQAVLVSQSTHSEEDVSLVLADDAQLQSLNRQYRRIDASTDVLSFPTGEVDPDSGAFYLGDVLISYPRAVDQAAAGGHPVAAELQLLVVHGMLHLYGYDHLDPQDKAQMWALQAGLLRQLGCPITAPASESER